MRTRFGPRPAVVMAVYAALVLTFLLMVIYQVTPGADARGSDQGEQQIVLPQGEG